MSVIYYCDAPGCVKKEVGRSTPEGWTGPEGWLFDVGEEKVIDACSEDHYDKAIEAAYPPEPEAEEQTITPDDVGTIEA